MKLKKSLSLIIICFILSLMGCQKEPTAAFTASKTSAMPNESVLFTNQTTDGDHYEWLISDGFRSSEQNISYSFIKEGEYMVTLTAFSKNGKKSNVVSQRISIGLAPACAFIYLPRFPKPGETVQFTDNSTSDPTAWLWDFGDGTTSTEENPTHIFATEKTYNLSLKVTNNYGYSTQTGSIIVLNQTPALPVANFTYTTGSNFTINFQDQSTGNPTIWLWNFGDETTSTIKNPTHQYSQAGTYTVTLKVTNIAGSNQTSQNINVLDYLFLVGNYSVVDMSNGGPYYYTDNITAGSSSDKFWTHKFGYYINALVYFTVSGTNITVPSQTVHCGQPPYDVDHTFQGNGSYTHSGANVTINITYSDSFYLNGTLYNFVGCTGTYTKMKGNVKNQDTKDKTWYLLQQQKK